MSTRSPRPDCAELIDELVRDLKALGLKWDEIRSRRPRPYSRLMALRYEYENLSVSDYCKGQGEQEIRESLAKLHVCAEHITIYRGTDKASIRPGDWVALEPGIAEWYVRDEKKDFVLSMIVSSRDVRWAGTDVSEWYYLPAELEGCIDDITLARIKKEIG